MSKVGRYALYPLVVLAFLLLALLAYLYFPRPLPEGPASPELVAHRGVHQTFPLDGLERDTCTAGIIYPPKTRYLENTIPSIRAAFVYGADVVEVDVHPTTDGKLAVFHDWTLGCRTDGRGVTHTKSMRYLKTLDVGYSYSADGGETYPFRGKGIGMMPTLEEVLQEFPNKTIAVNQKDIFKRTPHFVAQALLRIPERRRPEVYFFSDESKYALLKETAPKAEKPLPTRDEEKACVPDYLGMLLTGRISDECGRWGVGIPARYLSYVPGWPRLFLRRAEQAGLEVWVVDVDTKEDWEKVDGLPIDGVVTNRIEVIGPLAKA